MDTIKSSEDITRIFENGRRVGRRPASLLVLEREEHGLPGRVAFIAGKKWGNAVWRNRAKRRMRAICHELGGPWRGWDVVFMALPETTALAYEELLDDYRSSVRRLLREGREGCEERDAQPRDGRQQEGSGR